MNPETLKFIEASIKTIPDYPKPGILFRDITSLIENAEAFKATIDLLANHYRDQRDHQDCWHQLAASSLARRLPMPWGWASCRSASRASCRAK